MERGGLSPEASLPKVVRPASLQSGQKHSVIMNFRKIRTFWRMDPCKRRMALQAIILPPGVRWGVALLGVARTSALLSAWSSGRVYKSQEGEPSGVLRQAVRVQQVVKASLGVGGTCLIRSLVLQAILQRQGIPTDLRIGIRKQGELPEGHAWLEYQRSPINESPEQVATYTVFDGAAALDFPPK